MNTVNTTVLVTVLHIGMPGRTRFSTAFNSQFRPPRNSPMRFTSA